RAHGGVWAGQLRWGTLTYARVLKVLKNPCYAGAYVHGRYTSRRTVEPDGTVHTGQIERPRSEWPVLIHDHHEGYLTWPDYLANETKLAANRTNAGARPPREGSALCQGILVCGSCGKPMCTNYRTDQRPSYECSSRADRLTTPNCRSVVAFTVDDVVAERFVAAVDPTEIALALAAADEVADRHRRVSRAHELAVERARYEADRAERAFGAVEPENRLVARSLEARWEAKLAALVEAEQVECSRFCGHRLGG
ncbi:recombinase, partial [Rhodococcus sp. WS4]